MNKKLINFITIISLITLIILVFFSSNYLNKRQTLKGKASTGDCRDNPVPPPKGDESQNIYYYWDADCGKSCSRNEDCPQNTKQSSLVPQNQSNWCYGFESGAKCLMLISCNTPDCENSDQISNENNLQENKASTQENKASTGDCRDNPVPPPKGDESQNIYYYWDADCGKSCSRNEDCPQNTKQSSLVPQNQSNWCYGFESGAKCLMLISCNTEDCRGQQNYTTNFEGSYSTSTEIISTQSPTLTLTPISEIQRIEINILNKTGENIVLKSITTWRNEEEIELLTVSDYKVASDGHQLASNDYQLESNKFYSFYYLCSSPSSIGIIYTYNEEYEDEEYYTIDNKFDCKKDERIYIEIN